MDSFAVPALAFGNSRTCKFQVKPIKNVRSEEKWRCMHGELVGSTSTIFRLFEHIYGNVEGWLAGFIYLFIGYTYIIPVQSPWHEQTKHACMHHAWGGKKNFSKFSFNSISYSLIEKNIWGSGTPSKYRIVLNWPLGTCEETLWW